MKTDIDLNTREFFVLNAFVPRENGGNDYRAVTIACDMVNPTPLEAHPCISPTCGVNKARSHLVGTGGHEYYSAREDVVMDLKKRLDAAVALLSKVEWPPMEDGCCPRCAADIKDKRHVPGCELERFLESEGMTGAKHADPKAMARYWEAMWGQSRAELQDVRDRLG